MEEQSMNSRLVRIRPLTVVDLFAGAGGLSLGFSRDPRFEVVAAVEGAGDMAAAYRANHPTVKVYEEDVREFRAAKVKEDLGITAIDTMMGGPPCQSYSTIGRRSCYDPRGQLVEEYFRLVSEFRPALFLLENVRGLLTMDRGRLFMNLCDRCESLGYWLRRKVLNAADYGVPQVRERVLLVGTTLGHAFRFPRPTHCERGDGTTGLLPYFTLGDAIGDLPAIESGERAHDYASDPQNEYQAAMREGARRLMDHRAPRHGAKLVAVLASLPEGGSAREMTDAPEWVGEVRSYHNTYCRLWWGRPCTTITSNFGTPSSSRCVHPLAARGLTLREAARIQSFPDDYVFVGSRGSKCLQVANAVPPLLAAALASAVAEHFGLCSKQCHFSKSQNEERKVSI
jgi:DNA (cytosine-5)-methyltransferase 1